MTKPSRIHRGPWLRLSITTLTLLISAVLAAEDQPAQSLAYSPSLNLTSMDTSANPCEDFYQFACGGWIRNNAIPADRSRTSTYGRLFVDSQQYLWGLLEEVARDDPNRNATQQLIGDYFAACMDLDTIDGAGAGPLQPSLAAIEAMNDAGALGATIGALIAHSDSSSFFVALGAEQDAKQSDIMIGTVIAAGLGLPDREFYLADDAMKKENRKKYVEHLGAMFRLLGESDTVAAGSAATVMRIETRLARASLTPVEKRDPYRVYNRKSLAELSDLVPALDWEALFAAAGLEAKPWLNVTQPAFMQELQAIIEQESLNDLKTYLRWGLVNSRAQQLSKPFRDQDFAFYSAYLEGIDAQPPRWRSCVSMVDQQLGEALGREFVERNFPPAVRDEARRMSRQIQQAMGERIDQLGWMGPATREQAKLKLSKMRDKIGYPNQWRDYSSIRIDRADYYGNVTRATEFDLDRQLDRIGKPVDRDEWFMTPATVNAYYNPSMNDINFPAGVLMPPLYDPRMDDAPNYGNTGGTIGHELVHGFDDEGRQFDGDGNLRDWWAAEDAAAFEERAQCIRDQYASYRVIDDIFINADLTAGEDIADLGGLILAWHAWRKETENQRLRPLDGLTPDQRFFVGFAQWACAAERPESLRLHAATDPHSPPRYRINGVVVNMPEFKAAFDCPDDAAMVKPEGQICRIW
ncbi:MAG: M13 family metallopeptidase [Xanthomonadales bacterium]|nr:M13 family metallopeptidase [Xanthomonadales bacterium]